MLCPACGKELPGEYPFCPHCGAALGDTDEADLEARARKAFSDSRVSGYADDYLAVVRENWRHAEFNVRRATLRLVLIAVVFELMSRAIIAGAELGSLEINDISVIERLLPVIFAFTLYEFWYSLYATEKFWELHQATIRAVYRPLYEHDLEIALAPAGHVPVHGENLFAEYFEKSSLLSRLRQIFEAVSLAVLHGSFIAFTAYAFYRLFERFGVDDPLTWVSIVVSSILTSHGLLYLERLVRMYFKV
jgi:hypothetical protein